MKKITTWLCSVLLFTANNNNFANEKNAINITTMVVPAAGLGTRFLPFTKATPKELLPIMNKPAIDYLLQEGKKAGIHHYSIIINDQKQSIFDYLSHMPKLENILKEKQKTNLIQPLKDIIDETQFTYLKQNKPLGTGHAVLLAKEAVGKDYFCVAYPDNLFFNEIPALTKMVAMAKKYKASVIAVRQVPQQIVSRYGIVAIKEKLEENIFSIEGIIEKPSIENAPSNMAVTGRYILSPTIFDSLEIITPGLNGEYYLTDAIDDIIKKGERVIVVDIGDEKPHDIGNPLGWIKANITYALQNPTYTAEVETFLQNLSS